MKINIKTMYALTRPVKEGEDGKISIINLNEVINLNGLEGVLHQPPYIDPSR